MATQVICNPVGLQSQAGVERVAKAYAEFMDATAEVANLADEFLKTYDEIFAQGEPELADDALELHDACTARAAAQEELLRAIAGVQKAGA